MAQIPSFNQSQRLEPGSPVAATGAENSAGYIQGGAVEAFGNAMFNTGNMLDRVAKVAKDKIGLLTVEQASEAFKQDVIISDAERKATPILPGDSTGAVTTKAFMEEIKDKKAAFAAQFEDPELRLRFDVEAEQHITKSGQIAYADEVDKRAKIVPVLQDNLLKTYSASAFNDPTKLEEVRVKSEILIRESKDLAPKDMDLAVLAQNEAIVSSGAMGIVQRAKETGDDTSKAMAQFGLARKFVQGNLHILSDVKRDKLLNTIDTEEKQYIDTSYVTGQRIEAVQETRDKNIRSATMGMYTKQLAIAGNNDHAVRDIMARAASDPIIKGEDLKSLPGVSNIFKDSQDDKYQGSYMTKLINDKNPNMTKYNDQLNDAVNAGGLSEDRANKLRKFNEDISEKKIPNVANVLSETENLIKKSFTIYKPDPITNIPMEVLSIQGIKNAQKFQAQISREMQNGPVSAGRIISVGEALVNKANGGPGYSVRGVDPSMTGNPQAIDAALTQANLQYKRDGAKMTKQQKTDLLDKVNGLKQEKSRQLLNQGYPIKNPEIFKNTPLRSVDE